MKPIGITNINDIMAGEKSECGWHITKDEHQAICSKDERPENFGWDKTNKCLSLEKNHKNEPILYHSLKAKCSKIRKKVQFALFSSKAKIWFQSRHASIAILIRYRY